jgi:O-antigen ligase
LAQRVGFYFALALVFVRCCQIPELLTYQFNGNLYLLYVITVPVVLVLLFTKGLKHSFRFWPAYYWLGFALWVTLAIPFSIWKGGSFKLVEDYWRTNVVLLVALGGLIRNWTECRMLFRTLALSCLANLIIIHFLGQIDDQGRLNLQFGAIANSNDYAAHLFLLLPSTLWVAFVERPIAIRIAALATCGYGIYLILASGSRGALIALAVGLVYFLFSVSRKQRVWAIALIAVVLVATFGLLSGQVVQRIFSFSDSSGTASKEALESSDIRSQLLEDSIWYALENPLFGVGPGNFRTAEGKAKPGLWQPAHNSYIAVASECGFPAFLFFIGGIGSSFLIFQRVGQYKFRPDREAKELLYAAWCMRLAMLTFCIAVGFLNFSYSMHLPIMLGISIAVGHAAIDLRRRSVGGDQTSANNFGVTVAAAGCEYSVGGVDLEREAVVDSLGA